LRLPSGVTGPRDFAPLAREARICFSVAIRDSIGGSIPTFGLYITRVRKEAEGNS
jgi:hypothetical protein